MKYLRVFILLIAIVSLTSCNVVEETDSSKGVSIPIGSQLFTVKGYSDTNKTLKLEAAEWVNEDDTKRIEELELQGIWPLYFPNGYAIVRYEGEEFEYLINDSTKVALLNVVQPEASTIDELIKKAKGLDDFLCYFVVDNGVVLEAVEPYTA